MWRPQVMRVVGLSSYGFLHHVPAGTVSLLPSFSACMLVHHLSPAFLSAPVIISEGLSSRGLEECYSDVKFTKRRGLEERLYV